MTSVATKPTKRNRVMRYIDKNRESDGYFAKQAAMNTFTMVFKVVLLFGLCFLILQPLFNQFSLSVMSPSDLYDASVISIPRNFTWGSYRMAASVMNYWNSLFTSVGIAIMVSILQIAACTLTAYGFARFNFPLKGFWFMCVILTIIVPPQTIMAPMFLNFRFFDVFGIFNATTGSTVNLLDTLTGYLILVATGMGLRSGLYVFMLRQYFRTVPKELEEAAYVDGCGKLRTFVQIMLPDSKPILASCFLFAFVWQWTDGFYSTLFLRGQGVMSVQLSGLADAYREYYWLLQGHNPSNASMMALIATGLLMGVAPLVVLFLFTQRMFVESIGQSGIKM